MAVARAIDDEPASSAGKGSKGDRWYAWSRLAAASPSHCLLIRRHHGRPAQRPHRQPGATPVRPGQPPPAGPGMIALTVTEIARLLSRHAPPGHAA
jgi:hypothetical protein